MNIPERFNAASYFIDRHLDEGRAAKVAVLCGGRQFTYQQIAESVNRAANALARAGAGRSDRVLIALHDSPAFIAAFWGAIKLGAVAVPVSTAQSAAEYAFALGDSGARAVVVQDVLFDKIAPALAGTPGEIGQGARGQTGVSPAVLLAGGARDANSEIRVSNFQFQISNFESELAQSSPEATAAPTRRDGPAFWLYTSGSTGRPKAAIHRHRDMLYCLEGFAKGVLQITAADRTFSASKLFFAYGLGNGLYFPFGVGAETVLVPDRATPERVFEVIARHRPTIFYGVPSLYAAMLQAASSLPGDAGGTPGAGCDMSSVRAAVSAGEALPAALWQRFRDRFGIEILDGIGSTEMLHMFLSNYPGDIAPGSSGRLVPGYAVKIVDEHGQDVTPGEMGNLWARGGSAAAGYRNRPELTEATFLHHPDGEWIVTGDKYRRDERGRYWHCGRSDDMLKVHGLWVSPLEIESALIAHPAVAECAVVGARDKDGLVKPKAYAVLAGPVANTVALQSELLEFLKAQLPSYKVPRWLVIAGSLPKTATGKIQRYRLRGQ
ncbi:MAG TPA: benzoate-CoA ligase family protein [Terriglobia bacterium]|nr:benzoate-CoA ligase family protein [Terriglobia bacterium]